MARYGMSRNIRKVRQMCNLGSADYTINGVTYWTDEQVQDVIDRYRMTVYQEHLTRKYDITDGTVEYYDYYWRHPNVEQYGTANPEAWHLETGGGSAVGTASYTVNYESRHIRFSSDTGGEFYQLSYRTYDLDRAAAEIWDYKAAQVAERFDVSSDNHRLLASQLISQYSKMADAFRAQAHPVEMRVRRWDT